MVLSVVDQTAATPGNARLPSAIEFVVAPWRMIVQYRGILLSTTKVEMRGMYAGSMLGILWLVLGPLMLLTLYTVIYAVVFKFRPSGMEQIEYVLYIFCGLVPFLGFATSLISGSTSVAMNKQVLFNTVFPPELIPLRSVLVSGASILAGLFLVVIGVVFFAQPSATLLMIPVILILQSMFVTGLVWVLSLLSLIVRDIQQILSYVTIMLMIMSPIAYTPEMMPIKLKILVYINPLSYYLISFQKVILLNEIPSTWILIMIFTLSIASFGSGYWMFRKGKEIFFDYA